MSSMLNLVVGLLVIFSAFSFLFGLGGLSSVRGRSADMRGYFLLFIAIPLIILAALVYDVRSAFAASIFDNTITPIDKLILNPTDSGDSRDYSTDWYSEAVASLTVRCAAGTPGQFCSNEDLLAGMLDDDDANWAVIQPNPYEYKIIFSHDPTARVEFVDLGSGNTEARLVSDSSQSFVVTENFAYLSSKPSHASSNGTVYFSSESFTVYDYAGIGASYTPNRKVFLSTFPVVYPSGYAGPAIPGEHQPRPQYHESPDVFVVQGINHTVTIRDSRWFTFDDTPRNTCSQGLTPVIQYELRRVENNFLVDSGSWSPTVEYTYKWPDDNSQGSYTFLASYTCGDFAGEPIFIGQTVLDFSMSEDGVYVENFLAQCVTDSPPYVDMDGCTSALSRVINLLSFNTLKFGNNLWSNFQPSCGQLSTLGDWLGRPGQSVCPLFPSYVRDVVTPFVTLLLGLLMLNFIVKATGPGF